MDTRVTPEYDNRRRTENDEEQSLTKGLDVVCQCAALLERCVQSSTRVRKAQAVTRQTNPIGRSMIEMLGVLAIIGVLSVGGIAGYSKAMEKFKINKAIREYSFVTQGIFEYLDNIKTLNSSNERFDLTETFFDINITPSNWSKGPDYDGHKNLIDSLGNLVAIFVRGNRVVTTVHLGQTSASKDYGIVSPDFSSKICIEFFNHMIVPMQSRIYYAGVYRSKYHQSQNYYFNDKVCGTTYKCFKDISLAAINQMCHICSINEEYCVITWEFY